MEIDYILLAGHLIVGGILVFLASKAYLKTKFPAMLLLTIGFGSIVAGETIVEDLLFFLNHPQAQEIISELFEIAGFIVLILAVKKS